MLYRQKTGLNMHSDLPKTAGFDGERKQRLTLRRGACSGPSCKRASLMANKQNVWVNGGSCSPSGIDVGSILIGIGRPIHAKSQVPCKTQLEASMFVHDRLAAAAF